MTSVLDIQSGPLNRRPAQEEALIEVLAGVSRAGVRAVRSRCQTGRSRHYSRIEDQGAEDQQEPLQGDRSLDSTNSQPSGLIALLHEKLLRTSLIDEVRKLLNPIMLSVSATCGWCWTCISVGKIFLGRTECSEFAGRKTGKWLLRARSIAYDSKEHVQSTR